MCKISNKLIIPTDDLSIRVSLRGANTEAIPLSITRFGITEQHTNTGKLILHLY